MTELLEIFLAPKPELGPDVGLHFLIDREGSYDAILSLNKLTRAQLWERIHAHRGTEPRLPATYFSRGQILHL